MQRSRLGASVPSGDSEVHLLGVIGILGHLDEDVKVPVVIKDASVLDLVLGLETVSLGILVNQLLVGELSLGVLVKVLGVGVGGGVVDVVVQLLDILTVVTLVVGQTEKSLLEKVVLFVPESKGEAKELMVIGNTSKTVLTPSVGSGSSLVVREVGPGITVGRVILSDCGPLSLGHVGTPSFPVLC